MPALFNEFTIQKHNVLPNYKKMLIFYTINSFIFDIVNFPFFALSDLLTKYENDSQTLKL